MNKQNIMSVRDQLTYMIENHMLQGVGVDSIKNLIVELTNDIEAPDDTVVAQITTEQNTAPVIDLKPFHDMFDGIANRLGNISAQISAIKPSCQFVGQQAAPAAPAAPAAGQAAA